MQEVIPGKRILSLLNRSYITLDHQSSHTCLFWYQLIDSQFPSLPSLAKSTLHTIWGRSPLSGHLVHTTTCSATSMNIHILPVHVAVCDKRDTLVKQCKAIRNKTFTSTTVLIPGSRPFNGFHRSNFKLSHKRFLEC